MSAPSASNPTPPRSTAKPQPANITFEEYLDLTSLAFEWADSYDAKDWNRLRNIIAPTLLVDYRMIGKAKWDAMPADEFMSMVTDPGFEGDPCIKTQHLLGASRWMKVSDNFVIGYHQIRAAHQVYTAPDLKVVKLRGHSHATNELYYRKGADGVWKFAGLKPTVRWNEHEFEKVFKGSFISSPAIKSKL